MSPRVLRIVSKYRYVDSDFTFITFYVIFDLCQLSQLHYTKWRSLRRIISIDFKLRHIVVLFIFSIYTFSLGFKTINIDRMNVLSRG